MDGILRKPKKSCCEFLKYLNKLMTGSYMPGYIAKKLKNDESN